MWYSDIDPNDHADYALRTAACLGSLGYSPHEVVCIVAEQLAVERGVVAEILTCRGVAPVAAA